MKISDIPINLRPREKATLYGIETLSDQELLALIIGSGVRGNSAIDIADELLKTYGGSMVQLAKSSYRELEQFQGLKTSNALKLLATFEFHNRLNSPAYKRITKIEGPNDVYSRYQYLENFDQEVLVLIMLDLRMKIIKEKVLYKGTYDSFSIDVRQVIQEVILAKAKYFIIAHNHPDGETKPSSDDILTTKAIEKTAKNLGIKLIDHIIIFKDGFASAMNPTQI